MMFLVLLGTVILILVVRDVFQTVVVPRGKVSIRSSPILVRNILWPFFRLSTARITSPVWKTELLGLFGPFVVLVLLLLWIGLLIIGFGLITFARAHEYTPTIESLPSALFVAGSSVLTLGSSDYLPKTSAVRFLTLLGALSGMLITALVVSLLFTLIGSIQRREVLVSLTSNLGGSPPCGLVILETHTSLNGLHALGRFFDDWNIWCADVLESHKAYPLLPYFRSSDAFTSWITALGAALDAAALILTSDQNQQLFSAKLLFRNASSLVNEVAAIWHLDTSRTREIIDADFREVYIRLQEAGYCSLSEEAAKAAFEELRREYSSAQWALCEYLSVPQTPIISARLFGVPRTNSSS